MRASRLISLLSRLQVHGRLTAPEMADELEVSVRTIYRDIDQLSAAGIPVIADRGRTGGFHLVDGFRAQLTGLTDAEAETLLLLGLPGPAAELGLAELMTVARLKLVAALPPGTKTERLASRFHLDPAGWFRANEPVPLLPTIARALWSARYVKIRYAADKSPVPIGPAGLVLKGGVWYLVAQKGNVVRTYRVAKIVDAEVLERAYVRPRKFDLAAHWARSSREYERATYRDSAVVRLSPRGRALLETLSPYVADALAKAGHRPDKRGWVRCAIPVDAADFGIRDLLRLGQEVEIVSPPALRTLMAQTLRSTLKLYTQVARSRALG